GPSEQMASLFQQAVGQIDPLYTERHADWARLMHFLVLLVRHKREPHERDNLYNMVREIIDERRWREVEKMGMTDAQTLVAKGRQEGKREGKAELLMSLLDAKFGPLPSNVANRVAQLSDREVSEVSREVLRADSLAELGIG